MKKHSVAIISLFFSGLVFANTGDETTENSKKTESIDCKPVKQVVKKTYFKKKKIKSNSITPQSKIPTTPILIEEKKIPDNYVSSNQIFHIPQNIQIEANQIQSFAEPLKYGNVSYNVEKNGVYSELYLIDNRTNKHLDEYYLEKQSLITITNLDLLSLNFSQNTHTYSTDKPIKINDNTENCNRYFVSYKLKDETKFYQYSNYLNSNDINNKQCLNTINNIVSNSEHFSNNDFNLINVFLNTTELSNKKINFTLYIGKDGETFFPNKVSAFAVKEDLSEFYPLPIVNKNKVTGLEFSEKVTSGKYFIVLNYDYNNEQKTFRTLLTVK
jgi:hypothetical protein